jgi:hypothetical protein
MTQLQRIYFIFIAEIKGGIHILSTSFFFLIHINVNTYEFFRVHKIIYFTILIHVENLNLSIHLCYKSAYKR